MPVSIRLDLAGGKTLHDVLREFAGQTQGWTFPLEIGLMLLKIAQRFSAGFKALKQIESRRDERICLPSLTGL